MLMFGSTGVIDDVLGQRSVRFSPTAADDETKPRHLGSYTQPDKDVSYFDLKGAHVRQHQHPLARQRRVVSQARPSLSSPHQIH